MKALGVSFVVLLVVAAALMVLLIAVRSGAETVVASLTTLLPFSWAFAAGMVSSVNPCGFFMLPAYLSYQLGTEEAGYYESPAVRRAMKALLLGLVVTSGFIVVMALVGCTLPIFLLVVGSSPASQGATGSVVQFLSYASGMGFILVAVTIGAALFRGAVARVLRLAIPHVHRMSALLLVGAGFYLIYYWVVFSGSIL